MQVLATFAAGLIFGLALTVAGLVNPAKVLSFLDVAGAWDPSLAFTMAAAVLTTALGYRLAFAKGEPLLAHSFQLPAALYVDARLISGAAIFGVGWGLAGYCPGPAITALSTASAPTAIFVVAMLAGMMVARMLAARPRHLRRATGAKSTSIGAAL